MLVSPPPQKKILVVDEKQSSRDGVCRILRGSGYACFGAGDPQTGWSVLERERPDLVITDVMLGGPAGLDLIRRIRDEGPTPRPPVIAYSSFDDFRSEAQARGAAAFLLNPVHADDLLIAVESLLEGGAHPVAAAERAEQRARDLRRNARASAAEALQTLRHQMPDFEERSYRAAEWLRSYLSLSEVFGLIADGDRMRIIGSAHVASTAHVVDSAWRRMATDVLETGATIVLPDLSRWSKVADTESRIGFFVGVPIFGPGEVAVGALCAFDERPRHIEAEDVALLEALSRRAGGLLSGRQEIVDAHLFDEDGLLYREGFELVLRGEVRRLERGPHALELAVLCVGSGDDLSEVAAALQLATRPARRAVANLGRDLIGLMIVRDSEREARRELAAAVESVRGSLAGAGIVSVDSGGFPIPEEPQLLRLAERLAERHSLQPGGDVEALVFRPEALTPIAAEHV